MLQIFYGETAVCNLIMKESNLATGVYQFHLKFDALSVVNLFI